MEKSKRRKERRERERVEEKREIVENTKLTAIPLTDFGGL
jgi:hypothetical protein